MIDVGTTSVRAGVVRADSTVEHITRRALPPIVPFEGLLEVDADALGTAVLEIAAETLSLAGPVMGVGVTNQRGTTVLWEKDTGKPVANALGWQDLRTVGTCLELQAEGIRVAPNESITKLAWLLDQHDPDRSRNLLFGTIDTWIVWLLSEGRAHVTDRTNAGISGLLMPDASGWDGKRLERFSMPPSCIPKLVSTWGEIAEATALEGAPPIFAIVGDQQASLVGQGCVLPGTAKATFGTGAMLDLCTGDLRPSFETRGDAGTFPIVTWSDGHGPSWGLEAIVLSAGTAVDWLVNDLGIISSPAESASVAASCDDSGDVWYVPAMMGLGSPLWDFGARSTLIGMSNATGRPQIVRAVLEGVANRGADLLEAAEKDGLLQIERLRVDGGMSANDVFVQALANACGRPIDVSAQLEATTVGAGYLAGIQAGIWNDLGELAHAAAPRVTVEPTGPSRRERWLEARRRAERWIPELSELSF